MTHKLKADGFFFSSVTKNKNHEDRLDGTKTLVAARMLTRLARNVQASI